MCKTCKGLPSIAWNPDDGKSSFAEPMEDILRLKPSRCPGSKRRMEPMERLALSWGKCARQFTKLLLSLLSHIGGKEVAG